MSQHASTAQPTGYAEFLWEGAEVQGVFDLQFGNSTLREKEVTHLGSVRVERKGTLPDDDAYEVKFYFSWANATHVALFAAYHANTTGNATINWPQSLKTISGTAYINKWMRGAFTREGFEEITMGVREDPPWDWAALAV